MVDFKHHHEMGERLRKKANPTSTKKVYALIHKTRDTSITLEDRVYSSIVKICDSMETAQEERRIATTLFFNHDHYCPDLEWFEIEEFTLTERIKGEDK